jgi:hypothetical protein
VGFFGATLWGFVTSMWLRLGISRILWGTNNGGIKPTIQWNNNDNMFGSTKPMTKHNMGD